MRTCGLAIAAALLQYVNPALAAQCSVSAQSVSFGGYDVFSSQSVDSTGNIAVTCDAQTTYTIALSPGFGSYSVRSMVSGANSLRYNLFTDASHSTVWGDGTGGSTAVAGSAASAIYTVFGRIAARQNAHIGTYSDNLTITLTY
jgi:spore coat protein U-like protein